MKKLLLSFLLFVSLHSFSQTPFVKHYTNGLIKESGYIKNDKCDSTWYHYDVEGNITSIAHFQNGEKIGTWKISTDKSIIEIQYVQGKKIKYSEFTKEGNILIASINY